jgi:Tol biopolymer transport system component
MNSDGSNQHLLSPIPVDALEQPQWSPDGKFIAVRSGTHIEQDFRLVVLNADGSNPRELTKPAEGVFVYFPSWSPDGKHILYIQDDMNVEVISIVVVDADGSNQRALASDANLSSWPPAWSPDGKQIVFEAG